MMSSSAVNIWQILFVVTVVVYAVHVYFLSHEDRIPHYTTKQGSLPGRTQASRQSTLAKQPSHLYVNIEGEIGGRQYSILNESLSVQAEALALKRLNAVKEISSKSILVKDYGQKKLSQLRYLHIPRTGITFINTVVHYCCQLVDDIAIDSKAKYDMQPWKFDPSCRACLKQPITSNGEYWSYFPYILPHDRGHAVALFREPIRRISSQIVEMRSLRGMTIAFGIPKPDSELFTIVVTNKFNESFHSFLGKMEQNSLLIRNLDSTQRAMYDDFLSVAKQCYEDIFDHKKRDMNLIEQCRWMMAARYPGIRGCQTRMVLGRNCIDTEPISNSDMQLALKRLKEEFAFVGKYTPILYVFSMGGLLTSSCVIGLTSQWNVTVETFHKKFGGKLFLDELQPAAAKLKFTALKERVEEMMLKSGYSDPWDEELFKYADFLFKTSMQG